jgi:septum formation protein
MPSPYTLAKASVAISHDSPLVLASTSKYRAELLRRLGLPFVQEAPGVDENELPGEAPEARARRLAWLKAGAVAERHPRQWALGSDQVAYCGGQILHKPGTPEANVEQLLALSGKEAGFATAIALVSGPTELVAVDLTVVQFRTLSRDEVERYVAAEPAHDCAGGFKVEGLGISLFESVRNQDPTALVGLPLIALRRLLAEAGSAVP